MASSFTLDVVNDMQEKAPRRVAIFGGSFDPVHNGHLEIAAAALRQHQLERVVFVPARHQPHRTGAPRAPGAHRLAMLRLATMDRPEYEVSDCELKRPGKSFSVDTVRMMRSQLGPGVELYFLIGADSLHGLAKWKHIATLAKLCRFIVAARPGFPLDALDALRDILPEDCVAAMWAGAVRTTANITSSTEIRRRVAAEQPLHGLVPPAVAAYIAQNKLYSDAGTEYDSR